MNSSLRLPLLDHIQSIRASVGDGLNDVELSWLLRQLLMPEEAGFAFLGYSEGFVMLAVPPQELARWYPPQGWITNQQERLARAIADKYDLSLWEPVDDASCVCIENLAPECSGAHHHLELRNQWETVIIAHPFYLKIRIFGTTEASHHRSEATGPLQHGREILADLAALYRS